MRSEERTFLQAIRRRPGSDTVRFAYADWLLDRGDPRGEFIHHQVKASRLAKNCRERLDREAAADDLLLHHEAEWLGPLLGIAGNWEWRRGLLDWITASAQDFLANAPRWLPDLPVVGLHLRQAHPHINALAGCKQLASLNALYLGDNRLTDADLKVLLASPHLRRLRTLYLQSNELADEGVRHLAATEHLPRLRELCLGHNRLGDAAAAALAGSPQLRRLRSLNLMMSGLDEPGVQALMESRELAGLTMLNLGLNALPPGSLARRSPAPIRPGLRSLGYDFNSVDNADVIALARAPAVAGIRTILLTYGTYGDTALTELAASPHLDRLRCLGICTGEWTNAGIRAFGHSQSMKSLRWLSISGNSRGRGQLAMLLRQPLIRRLTALELEINPLRGEELAALASHRSPLRLRVLKLPLAADALPAWDSLLRKRLLSRVTELAVQGLPAGAAKTLVEPGLLPDLRQLTLFGLGKLDDVNALLESPLFGQLHELEISLTDALEQRHGSKILHGLLAVWRRSALRRVGLFWSLSDRNLCDLARAQPPPALTELRLGSFAFRTAGMRALASSPLLGQLRRLEFHNSSHQNVNGVEELIDSPTAGPLLRIDIHNGDVPDELVPLVRRRFGYRFAVSGRKSPRTISVGGWDHLSDDLAD